MAHVIRHEGRDEEVAVVVALRGHTGRSGGRLGSKVRASCPHLVQSEDHGDVLRAHGDQVVRQQLAGRQELVVAALVDEDVQPGPRVGGG